MYKQCVCMYTQCGVCLHTLRVNVYTVCLCVCVCVCERERERERETFPPFKAHTCTCSMYTHKQVLIHTYTRCNWFTEQGLEDTLNHYAV